MKSRLMSLILTASVVLMWDGVELQHHHHSHAAVTSIHNTLTTHSQRRHRREAVCNVLERSQFLWAQSSAGLASRRRPQRGAQKEGTGFLSQPLGKPTTTRRTGRPVGVGVGSLFSYPGPYGHNLLIPLDTIRHTKQGSKVLTSFASGGILRRRLTPSHTARH